MSIDNYQAFEHHATSALNTWLQLLTAEKDPYWQGDILVKMGTLFWDLGQKDRAIAALNKAVDTNPNGALTHTKVIGFFVIHDHYRNALDTYHRALGNTLISDYVKVFMSLWILAESRRKNVPTDKLVLDYIKGRSSRIWHDRLAQFAIGRASLESLQELATRPNQQAELLYYQAIFNNQQPLQETRNLLMQVLSTGAIATFEYDLAKAWLAQMKIRPVNPPLR